MKVLAKYRGKLANMDFGDELFVVDSKIIGNK
jgi:hypothetical protein